MLLNHLQNLSNLCFLPIRSFRKQTLTNPLIPRTNPQFVSDAWNLLTISDCDQCRRLEYGAAAVPGADRGGPRRSHSASGAMRVFVGPGRRILSIHHIRCVAG